MVICSFFNEGIFTFLLLCFKNEVFHIYFGEFHLYNIGIYTWSDRRQFIGDWKNNKMDGEGVFVWPDRRKYTGQYKDDKKHGYGVFEWY